MSVREIATIETQNQEYTLWDRNITSDEIAFSSFSGMMGFMGELGKQTIENYGLNALYGSRFGRVFDVVDGVINGVFDANMNPDKSLEKLIGTQFLAWGAGEIGASIGFLIGGPVGAVAGATIGSIIGGINADDWYEGGEKLVDILSQKFEEFKYRDVEILAIGTKSTLVIENVKNGDIDFCKRVFQEHKDTRQIVTIKNSGETLADFIKYNSKTKEAKIKSNTLDKEKEYVELITKTTQAQKIQINNQTFNITQANNLTVRNSFSTKELLKRNSWFVCHRDYANNIGYRRREVA